MKEFELNNAIINKIKEEAVDMTEKIMGRDLIKVILYACLMMSLWKKVMVSIF